MPKVIDLTNQDNEFGGHMVECPGCGCGHLFDKRWTFNGNYEKPTFTPSMLVNANTPIDPPRTHRCHSFVTDGKIQFLNDCTHELAGQTVDLPEIDR